MNLGVDIIATFFSHLMTTLSISYQIEMPEILGIGRFLHPSAV